jgi:hypothetical protein
MTEVWDATRIGTENTARKSTTFATSTAAIATYTFSKKIVHKAEPAATATILAAWC